MNSIPRFGQVISVVLARPGYCLGELPIGFSHDEDTDDRVYVLLPLVPLVSPFDLPSHQLVGVVGGSGLKILLGAVLHFNENRLSVFSGTEKIEADAPFSSALFGHLYVFVFYTGDFVDLSLQNKVKHCR